MLKTFKNIELGRYYLSQEIISGIRSLKDKVSNAHDSILASMIAVAPTFGASKLFEDCLMFNNIYLSYVMSIFMYIVIFLILFFIFKCLILFFRNICVSRSIKRANFDSKKIVDKFDHIACSSILISIEFKKEIESKGLACGVLCNPVDAFNFYELIYYFRKSIEVTNVICNHWDSCVKSEKNILGVSLYRLENILKLYDDIYNFINTNKCAFSGNFVEELDLEIENISKMKKNITNIKNEKT